MDNGQQTTASSGPKGESPIAGSEKRLCVRGPAWEVQGMAPHAGVPAWPGEFRLALFSAGSFHDGLWWAGNREEDLDRLIEALKAAKAKAFPKPKKELGPQAKQLLAYLKQKSGITAIKARQELGIEHLPRRIKDLKEHGYKIVTDLGKDFSKKRYATYRLTANTEPKETP